MVGVEVGQDDQRDPVDSQPAQAPVHQPGVGTRVDDDGVAVPGVEDQPVSLAHVARHQDPAGRRPPRRRQPDEHRDDQGDLIVTISQNSIGNAITELLGVVVKREPDAAAYALAEPALVEQLLEVRRRLVAADCGTGIATAQWGAD